jgi:glycosyltransferase involved in cell wall biosynthesis
VAVKVIVVTSSSPFIYGGATLLVDWLHEALAARGHEVEVYRIPFHSDPHLMPGQMVGMRLWDFTGHGDRLITIRTPSYLIRHHSKVVWFLHHHRPAYDLWDSYRDVPDDPGGREFRRMMFVSDEAALAECKTVFVNSRRVGDRLRRYNGIESEVLYPPLGESVDLTAGPLGDQLVYVSRIVPHKRQLLAVQALAHTRSDVRLVIAGGVGSPSYADEIRATITDLGLTERVSFLDQVISTEDKKQLVENALGVVYLPLDEDSYGYVGLEAAAAGKPLITTTDSGGVLELVQDGESGIVTSPTQESIASAFDDLYFDRESAAQIGRALHGRVAELQISWDHVIDRLLA